MGEAHQKSDGDSPLTSPVASLGGNITPPGLDPKLFFAGISGVVLFAISLFQLSHKQPQGDGQNNKEEPNFLKSILLFCYSCFLKPHPKTGAKGTQQDALEAFYSGQAG